jgi:hypothetical protein
MDQAASEDDYFWIRQWGHHTGSDRDAIEREVERARREKAPPNAIYYQERFRDGDCLPAGVSEEQKRGQDIVGVWQTTAGITQPDTRLALEQLAGRPLPENEERGG